MTDYIGENKIVYQMQGVVCIAVENDKGEQAFTSDLLIKGNSSHHIRRSVALIVTLL